MSAASEDVRIHRTSQSKNFTIVPNALIRDPKLSHAARGCLIQILSNIDTWHVTAKGMWLQAQKAGTLKKGEGKNAHFQWFTEMEAAGYLTRHRVAVPTERGNPTYETRLHFYDTPVPASQRTTMKPKDADVRVPSFREPEEREPDVREPEDRESIRRTSPKKDQDKEEPSQSSSALRAAGDDDRDMTSPGAGTTSAPPKAGAASLPAGAAAEVITRINGLLDHDRHLVPNLARSAVARLLGRFPADHLVDAIDWMMSSDYTGRFYFDPDTGGSFQAILVSQLGNIAEEWARYRARNDPDELARAEAEANRLLDQVEDLASSEEYVSACLAEVTELADRHGLDVVDAIDITMKNRAKDQASRAS